MIDPVDPSHLILSSIFYTYIPCTIVFVLQTSYEFWTSYTSSTSHSSYEPVRNSTPLPPKASMSSLKPFLKAGNERQAGTDVYQVWGRVVRDVTFSVDMGHVPLANKIAHL